jgi:hypothetical protein
MKNWLSAAVLMIFVSLKCIATPQALDIVKYNGKEYFITNNEPLYSIVKARSIELNFNNSISTACWRGYIARFEITKGRLYLTEVASCNDPNDKADLSKLFGKEFKDGKVFFPWFTGNMNLGRGMKWIWYDRRAFDDEQDIFLENGKVIWTKGYDNSRTIASRSSIMDRSSDQIYSKQIQNMIALTKRRSVTFEIIGDSLQRVSVARYLTDSIPQPLKDLIEHETSEKVKNFPVLYQKGKFTPLPILMHIAYKSN